MSFTDALAWYRMPRYEENKNGVLPDIGYEIVPYNCPLESPKNIQTYILEVSIIINIILALLSDNGLFVITEICTYNKYRIFIEGDGGCVNIVSKSQSSV